MLDGAPSMAAALDSVKRFVHDKTPYPFHRCIGAGMVPGTQTIARAELFAVYQALLHANTCTGVYIVVIHTDSAYVIFVLQYILQDPNLTELHLFANSDIILKIASLPRNLQIQLRKVKSHQDLSVITDSHLCWEALGN